MIFKENSNQEEVDFLNRTLNKNRDNILMFYINNDNQLKLMLKPE